MKFIRIFLIMLMLFSTSVCYSQESHLEFFVDCKVSEGGDGSIEKPFKTVEDAQKKIRALKKANQYPKDGITVTLREGNYIATNSVEFTAEDSGMENAPVVWRSYPLEEVVFSGGATIKLRDCLISRDERIPVEAQGRVYEYDLIANGIEPYKALQITGHSQYYIYLSGLTDYNGADSAPEIYYNDKSMTLARYPNNGEYMTIERVEEPGENTREYCRPIEEKQMERTKRSWDEVEKPVFVPSGVGESRLQRWKQAEEPWVLGYWFYDWSDQTAPLKEIDPAARQLTLALPSAYTVKKDQRFYIFNLLEELDVAGEWFYERRSGKLFLYPENPSPDGNIDIAFSSNPLLTVNGASNIEFYNLVFTASRSDAIKVANSKKIKIFGCDVKNVATDGITTDDKSDEIIIDSCHVYNIGSNGVSVQCGDSETLKKGNSVLTNCWIHDFGRLVRSYSGAVRLGGVNNIIRNNLMYNGPHYAMGLAGNDNLVERNEIHSVLQEAADAGAIYTGRSSLQRGNVVRENVIRDITSDSHVGGQYGLYIDDLGAGVTVSENLFYNINGTAVFINGGRDNKINNNIFSKVQAALSMSSIGYKSDWGYDLEYYKRYLLQGQEWHLTEPYSKYDHLPDVMEDEPLKPKYNEFMNNVGYQVDKMDVLSGASGTSGTITEAEMRQLNTVKDNLVVNDKEAFVNIETGNFNIASDSVILEKLPTHTPIDYNKAGLITSRLKHTLSDNAVVLSIGKPRAYANWKQKLIDEENLSVIPFIKNDRTMVPLRFLVESLGGEIEFSEGVIRLTYGGKTMELKNGSDIAVVDGEECLLDTSVLIVDGRTFIPLRNCSELLGKKVFWDDRGLIIVSNDDMTNFLDEDMITNLIDRLKY